MGWLKVLFLSLLFGLHTCLLHSHSVHALTAVHPPAKPSPVLLTTTPREWENAKARPLPATLQISFFTTLFDKNDVFSYVFSQVPRHFPDFKLNTIGRELHATLLYLNGLTLDATREFVQFFSTLDSLALEAYGLLDPVQVFDSENIEIIEIGRKSKFLALKPHRELIEWQRRFYKLLSEKAPHLLNHHQGSLDPEQSHISVIQWNIDQGFSDEKIAKAKAKVKELFQDAIARFKQQTGKSPEIKFSLNVQGVELVTAPASIHTPPVSILTFKTDASLRPVTSTVGRWSIIDPLTGFIKVVEFDMDKLRNGDPASYQLSDSSNGVLDTSLIQAPPVEAEVFKANLPDRLKKIFEDSIHTLSPTQYPAVMGDTLYFTRYRHQKLDPLKAIPVFKKAHELGLKSTEHASIGLAVYASSVREDILNPSDYDMLLNTLIHVSNSARTIDEAEKIAAEVFVKEVLSQLLVLVRKGVVSIQELRVGSEATMGLPYQNILDALEANPYLTEQDILSGYFKDKTGKVWTIEELVSLGDFIKTKLDYMDGNHHRTNFSLQFVVGFEWQGQIRILNASGLKGIPPLMRTAVYDSAESFAVAAALSRPSTYYSIQKGPVIPKAIRDLQNAAKHYQENEITVYVKLIKKIYNFFILLSQSGLGLEEIFFKEVQNRADIPPEYSLLEFMDELVKSINQTPFKVLNELRRNVNDLREYNERGQVFDEAQWQAHRLEMVALIGVLKGLLIQYPTLKNQHLTETLIKFENFLSKTQGLSFHKASLYLKEKRLHKLFYGFELELLKLEQMFLVHTSTPAALSEKSLAFIQVLLKKSPEIYLDYLAARSQEAGGKLEWTLKYLGLPCEELLMGKAK